MKKSNKGFSLLELIVVIAIMAVLVGILAPTLIRYVEKARIGKDEAAMGEFLNALYLAATDRDAYDDIPAAGDLFVYDKANNRFVVNDATLTDSFRRELAGSVGDSISFSSKKWQSADEIKVTVKPNWDSIEVKMRPNDLMTNYQLPLAEDETP